VLIGHRCVLALLLWEPHLEGRNAHATTFEIYFKDPFPGVCVCGFPRPFFSSRSIGRSGCSGTSDKLGAFSQVTVEALRAIKRCAISPSSVFGRGSEVVFILMFGDKDDRPAGNFHELPRDLCFERQSRFAAAMCSRGNLQNTLRQSEGSRG